MAVQRDTCKNTLVRTIQNLFLTKGFGVFLQADVRIKKTKNVNCVFPVENIQTNDTELALQSVFSNPSANEG